MTFAILIELEREAYETVSVCLLIMKNKRHSINVIIFLYCSATVVFSVRICALSAVAAAAAAANSEPMTVFLTLTPPSLPKRPFSVLDTSG